MQVLGTGCPKCRKLYEAAQAAVQQAGVEAEVSKVDDINEILKFGVMMAPALVVDGAVKAMGRVPRVEEIVAMLKAGEGMV